MSRAVVLVLLAGLAGCQDRGSSPAGGATTTRAALLKRYTRAEFEEAVKGKTKAEVMARFGRPSSTTGEREDSWTYEDMTVDPVSGKTDSTTWVWFDADGKVARVHY